MDNRNNHTPAMSDLQHMIQYFMILLDSFCSYVG